MVEERRGERGSRRLKGNLKVFFLEQAESNTEDPKAVSQAVIMLKIYGILFY